jgi:uncharacterized protein (TIGR02217 family)
MSFHDTAIFPETISKNSTRTVRWNTKVIKHEGGSRSAIPYWTEPLVQIDASRGSIKTSDVADLVSFFRARIGATYGFRIRDWWDYASNASGTLTNPGDVAIGDEDQQTTRVSDGLAGVGNASDTQFQLVKRYVDGGYERIRPITKPISGTVMVSVDGSNSTEGSNHTIDYSTGIITFTTVPGVGETVEAGFEFHIPAALSQESDLDGLFAQLTDYDNSSVPSIIIDEIRAEIEIPEVGYPGGSTTWGAITANIQINLGTGRAHSIDPQQASQVILLPGTDYIAAGVGHFFITNLSATYAIDIAASGVAFFSLAASSFCEIGLMETAPASGIYEWVVFG